MDSNLLYIYGKTSLVKLLCLLLLASVFSNKIDAQVRIDTSSLTTNLSKEIAEDINSRPPVILARLYKNGKRIRSSYAFYCVLNNEKFSKAVNGKIRIDTMEIKNTDSIRFLISYKEKFILSQNSTIVRLKHGGTYTAGIITDYCKMKNLFESETPASTNLFYSSEVNYLNFAMIQTVNTMIDCNNLSYLKYSAIASNLTEAILFRYDNVFHH